MQKRQKPPRRLPRQSWTLDEVRRLQSLLLARLTDVLRQPDLDPDTLIRTAHAVSQATNVARQTIVDHELETQLRELEDAAIRAAPIAPRRRAQA